jgi:tubulin monoglycylase TTLL3/8
MQLMMLWNFAGIMCYNKLEDMLKLVSSTVVKKEGKFVVQKYIGL